MREVLGDLVIDHRDSEWRLHARHAPIVMPKLSCRYFLLISPDCFGVRVVPATSSSSTIAHPRKLTFLSAANTAGRSTFPCPSSMKWKVEFGCEGEPEVGSTSLM